MDISGPCHVLRYNRQECDLYLVTTKEPCPMGTKVINYFFQTNDDAEKYIPYLYQIYGIKSLNNKVHSTKLAYWEKKEYGEFLDSIDTSILENSVKDIKVTTETIIIKRGLKK